MSTDLVKITPNTELAQAQQGGLGIDFNSHLFRPSLSTLNINQPTTTAEGAIPGHLRISETGDQFKEMYVTFLKMPVEQRNFYVGEPGQLNRSSENLMCFTRNVERNKFTNKELQGPDTKAKQPQALKCATCPKSSWDKYRQTQVKEDIPPCDAFYYAELIDTVYQMPLRMYIRSSSKKPFEQGLKNLSNTFLKLKYALKDTGRQPNIFDIKFKLTTEKLAGKKTTSYALKMSDFSFVTDEERAEFGDLFLQFHGQGQTAQEDLEEQAAAQVVQSENVIDAQVINATGGDAGDDGYIPI